MARRVTSKTKIFQIKVELRDVRPPVWRRVQVPAEMTLAELNVVIQDAMGWTDSHLHEFEVDGVSFGAPDPDAMSRVEDEAKARLFRVAGEGTRMDYTNDVGDDWRHRLTVEKVLEPEPAMRYPRCLTGRRACPPEDIGGPWGYQEFLVAIADPDHPEHEHYREWCGGSFDPARFDAEDHDAAMERLGWAPVAPTVARR